MSILTFLIFVKLPPGNPAIRAAGRAQTPGTIAAARTALGLDKPVWVQYWRFAKGLIPLPGFFLNIRRALGQGGCVIAGLLVAALAVRLLRPR